MPSEPLIFPTREADVSQADVREAWRIKQELDRRKIEALRLYEPQKFQQLFHGLRNKEVLIIKGNQVGGPTRWDTPVLTPDGWVPISDLRVGDLVIGGDGKPCHVTSVTDKGVLPTFELTFDDGAKIVCSECHLWKCKLTKTERFKSHPNFKADKWRVCTLRHIREHGGDDPEPRDRAVIPVTCVQHPVRELPMEPYLLGVLLGDGCVRHGVVSFTTEDAEIAARVAENLPAGMNMRVTRKPENGKASAYYLSKGENESNAITLALRQLGVMECRSEDKFVPREYMFADRESRIALLQGLMDTDGHCAKNGVPFFYTCSTRLAEGMVALVRSLGGKASYSWKETSITVKKKTRGAPPREASGQLLLLDRVPTLQMAVVQMRLPADVPVFGLERKQSRRANYQHAMDEGRVLHRIRPAGNARCLCIGVDHPDHTYVTQDYIVTHNSLAAFVELARALTGRDPHGKYPERDGIAACLGYGEKHIGRVMHKYLFRAGAFEIIRDLQTDEWRTYRPWPAAEQRDGRFGDLERRSEAKPAPPLIPQRFIEEIAWEKKSERIFSIARFTTGWELHALNSAGDPSQAQGFQLNLLCIDEDLANSGWLEEMMGRLSMREGLARWAAVPHAKTEDMMDMLERAEQEEDEAVPLSQRTTVSISATIYDNMYMPEKSRRENEKIWRSQGEDVYAKRALGKITRNSLRMYPTFSKQIHDICRPGSPDKLREALEANQWSPPGNWCRYMYTDPGHTVCAVLYGATPPPEFGNHHVIYAESYLTNADKFKFGVAVKQAAQGDVFEDFIIDAHGGRLREIGSGIHPQRQYEEQLALLGVKCVRRGARFMHGSDDVKGREEKLREWLGIREDGYPTVYVVVRNCPNLCREMERFRKKTVKIGGQDVPTDEGHRRANTHAVECLEGLAAHGMAYVKPRGHALSKSYVDLVMEQRRKQAARRAARGVGGGKSYRVLGPRGA